MKTFEYTVTATVHNNKNPAEVYREIRDAVFDMQAAPRSYGYQEIEVLPARSKERNAAASTNFDLKKFRQAVIESGLTDADIDELISRLLPTPGEK